MEYTKDEFGFISPSPGLLSINDILEYSAVLVRGRPWMGKTYIAREIRKQQSQLELGKYVWPLPLEEHTAGRSIKSAEWGGWCASTQRACWIVDSLDEGELLQPNIWTEIKRLIEDAGDAARDRLKLIIFVRETEAPRPLIEFLAQFYDKEFIDVELMPLDITNARRMIAQEDFEATLEAIRSRSLQGVCCLPAALEYIRRHTCDPGLTEVRVWEGVLKELLREKGKSTARTRVRREEIDCQFKAAARMAVILTFSDLSSLAEEGATSNAPSVAELFKADPLPSEPRLQAGRAALKTEMFIRGRFAQKNIREWMCAFGLQDVSLSRLKPLITDQAGDLTRRHWGVISLLPKTTGGRNEIGEWLCEKNGGVVPHSDLSTLTLPEAEEIVDRLERIADTTEWNVGLWGERGLKNLKVTGIGDLLAKRLADISRSVNKRDLLVQIAIETKSREVLPVARVLVEDTSENEDLRRSALGLLLRLSPKEELLELADFVRTAQPTTAVEKSIVSALIRRFLEAESWSLEEAAAYAPDPEGDAIDSTHVLARELEERITPSAARIVVRRKLPWIVGRRRALASKRSRNERREDELLRAALECLLQQEPPNDDDLEMLMPLALRKRDGLSRVLFEVVFIAGFARSVNARRKLYLAELNRSARRKGGTQYREYRWILQSDDLEWLMQRLPRLANKDLDVWADLLVAAHLATTSLSLKRRARCFVRKHQPGRVESFDRNRKKYANQERRREAEREQRNEHQRTEEVQIHDVVQQILSHDTLTKQQRMWDLSWICFGGDQGRPSNIVGTWEDLAASAQSQVLDACQAALEECEATAVPDGSTFPSALLYEAWCLHAVLRERANEFALNGELISFCCGRGVFRIVEKGGLSKRGVCVL